MRFDPQIEVVCDRCGANDYWSPDYAYHSMSGESGQYDTSDAAFDRWCEREGWSQDGEKTFCPDCTEQGAG